MRSSPYDAVFLGGGLASGMMARYLKREYPDLKILVVEKNTTAHFNPGESTVGVAGLFLIRDLGLSTYLYQNHLPKCGLRYFFHRELASDDEVFDATSCSEIGPNILPIFPTFQVNRKRLDEDLWRLNQEIGIEVRTGTLVTGIDLRNDGSLHTIDVATGENRSTVSTRWVVNSLGRAAKINRVFDELSPVTVDQEHRIAAAWGRFSNTADIDLLGDAKWRQKVGYTARFLSTNHFMGRGYWIWAIPIGDDVVSWGVVYDKTVVEDLGSRDAFLAFVTGHPFARELLRDASLIDFQSHGHLTWQRERFCSENRWATVGDANGFVDPFYSPGCDVLSRQAYYLEHLIPEKDPKRLGAKVKLLNAYARCEHELMKLLYKGQYPGFGSYELFNIKSLWDFYSYTNRLIWSFYDRKYKDEDFLRAELNNQGKTMRLTAAIQTGFRDLGQYLMETGAYERQNLGQFSLRQNRFRIEEQILVKYDDSISLGNHFDLCKLTVSELIECRFDIDHFLSNYLAQSCLTARVIGDFTLTQTWLSSLYERIAAKLQLAISRRFSGSKYSLTVDSTSFSQKCPGGLEDAPPEVREFAAELWQKKAVNGVAESLLRGPDAR